MEKFGNYGDILYFNIKEIRFTGKAQVLIFIIDGENFEHA